MLWDVADKVKRQRQSAQMGYSARKEKREDHRSSWGLLTPLSMRPVSQHPSLLLITNRLGLQGQVTHLSKARM